MINVALAVTAFSVQCALAWLGLALSRWQHKFLFFALVIVGAAVTAVAVKRDVDASSRVEADLTRIQAELQDLHAAAPKQKGVESKRVKQTATATFTLSVKPNAEYLRRYKVLNALRIEYILSHRDLPTRILAGTEWPPLEWINRRLAKLGEAWTVLPGKNTSEIRFHNMSP